MAEPEIPLTDVIRQLRRDLLSAMQAGEGESLRFEVQDLEVEMQVVVTRGGSGEVSGGGGVKLWVLDAKAGSKLAGKYEASRLQKVKLRLRPKTEDDDGTGTVDLAG